MSIWIGSADLDRLFSYPQRHNLSSSWFPIHFVAARAHTPPHVGPMICTWALSSARGQRRPRAGYGVYVRIKGLTRIFSGSRATNTPGQAPLCPKRGPSQPQHPVFSVFHRGGLRFGRLATPSRDLTATKRGKCTIRGTTRRRHAEGRLLMLQNPRHYPWCHIPSLVHDCPAGCR